MLYYTIVINKIFQTTEKLIIGLFNVYLQNETISNN